jgi:hypothetical protein
MSNIDIISARLVTAGVKHIVVRASEVDAKSPPRNVPLHFKSSSERARLRREAKKYRLAHKSQLKLKAKKYRTKMKHKKPNPILSRRAKQVHKKFKY